MESSMKENDAVNDQKMAEALLGAVQLPLKTSGYKPSREALEKPLPDEDYAVWCFCSGCGTVIPVLRSAVSRIIKASPEDWKGRYVSVTGCDFCDQSFTDACVMELPLSS